MSDIIPVEIQAEILKRLPIKPLIQFRSVSKPWKSLIDSSEFIADFNLNHTQPQHILVSYNNNDNDKKYVSILDDDSFPQHKFPLTLPISCNDNQLSGSRIIGSSKGLLCLYSYYPKVNNYPKTAVIWNPSIRKSVFISVPNVLPCPYETVIGFGVCPHTNQPKLVKFIHKQKLIYKDRQNRDLDDIFIPPLVEICTCKSRVWRSLSTNLPRESIALTKEHVAIDKFIYWLGYDRTYVDDDAIQCDNLILLFDITNEEFTEEINLPDGLQGAWDINMRMSKLRDSVIVIETDIRADDIDQEYDVWMLENGVAKSFRKLYTIKASNASISSVLGFRKSGESIINMLPYSDEQEGLFVYDSNTEQFSYIGISGNGFSHLASSYVESLLLLDH